MEIEKILKSAHYRHHLLSDSKINAIFVLVSKPDQKGHLYFLLPGSYINPHGSRDSVRKAILHSYPGGLVGPLGFLLRINHERLSLVTLGHVTNYPLEIEQFGEVIPLDNFVKEWKLVPFFDDKTEDTEETQPLMLIDD